MAEFIITTDPESSQVEISIDDDAEFIDWMQACEFLLHKTAQQSEAGYEKALELLIKGSMTHKTVVQED